MCLIVFLFEMNPKTFLFEINVKLIESPPHSLQTEVQCSLLTRHVRPHHSEVEWRDLFPEGAQHGAAFLLFFFTGNCNSAWSSSSVLTPSSSDSACPAPSFSLAGGVEETVARETTAWSCISSSSLRQGIGAIQCAQKRD